MPATFDHFDHLGHNLAHRHVAVSASTNSELIAAVKSGVIDSHRPYMLTASTQTAGRGQHGRTWQSPTGNVYLSLYYPLEVPLSGLLSLMIGYHLTRLPIIQGINRQLRQLGLPSIGIKWANDIGFYESFDKGFYEEAKSTAINKVPTLRFNKLAGILIEPIWVGTRMTGVVVGVGLNVVQAPLLTKAKQEALNYNAVSLSQLIACASKQPHHSPSHNISNLPAELPKATLKPEDLYLPISGAIGRAITQFKACCRHPYSIHQFVGDYARVDVLAGRRVMIESQLIHNEGYSLSSSTQQIADAKARTVIDRVTKDADDADTLVGLAVGIGSDGSLRLQQDSLQPLRVYTGKILVLTA